MQLLLAVACTILICISALENSNYYTVYKNEHGEYSVKNLKDINGVAWCSFQNNMSSEGWSYLDLETNPKYDDRTQMFAAGFLEAHVSPDLIWANYYNLFTGEWNSTEFSSDWNQWMEQNIAFMNASQSNKTDPYWQHVGLIWEQLTGMVAGYAATNPEPEKEMTLWQFLVINMDGDLEDLLPALNETAIDWDDMDDVARHYKADMRCSGLVKVTDNFTDIFVGHSTWESYYEMTRMFKTYRINVGLAGTKSKVVMMSSYPGIVSSIDDFYQMDTGLVVVETTNGLMNNSLYGAVTPESVLSFIRVMVANRMSQDGSEWVSVFSRYNSGTYNNQWMVVDMNKLDIGVGLRKGALYVVEQIPGYIESMDATSVLEFGYWGSFNVPYFENIYNVSDFIPYAKKYGTMFTYQNNPRAEIFRRDANKVEHVTHMQYIMRYNDYEHDVLSQGNAGNGISSRFDLNKKHIHNPFLSRSPEGAIDSKVTSYQMWQEMTVLAQSGPTHDQQPPFEYTGEWASQPHMGQPTTWNFDWVQIQAKPSSYDQFAR